MNEVQGRAAASETQSGVGRVTVLCVDDNLPLAEALKFKLEQAGGFEWLGWLPCADKLLVTAREMRPQLLILDIDMPGQSPFEAMEELLKHFPDTRAIMFTSHVHFDLINKALESGAWGYISKNDGEAALVKALRDVAANELVMSPEVRAAYERRLL